MSASGMQPEAVTKLEKFRSMNNTRVKYRTKNYESMK